MQAQRHRKSNRSEDDDGRREDAEGVPMGWSERMAKGIERTWLRMKRSAMLLNKEARRSGLSMKLRGKLGPRPVHT